MTLGSLALADRLALSSISACRAVLPIRAWPPAHVRAWPPARVRAWLRERAPMCASWIMLTSLAPSPMPSVMTPVLLTSAVTRAFCLGDTRQHTTAAHARPTCARGPNPSCLTRRVSSLGDQRHCASSLRRPAPGCKQGLYKCSEALSGCTSLREEALPERICVVHRSGSAASGACPAQRHAPLQHCLAAAYL